MITKRIAILVVCHLLFTSLQVYLISKISLIGRIGIAIAYKQYAFLRSPSKTYALLIGIQLLVIGLLWYFHKKFPRPKFVLAVAILVFVAVLGLYFTYNDFAHTYTHRLLKERFHLGFYLFWIAWIGSCVVFLTLPRNRSFDLKQIVPGQPDSPTIS